MSLGIKTSHNRFSVLGDEFSTSKRNKHKNDNQSNVKVTTNKNPPPKNKPKGNQSKNKNQGKKSVNKFDSKQSPSFSMPTDDWLATDEVIVEKMFHDDVARALELSKQEFEKKVHDNAVAKKLKGKRNPTPKEKKVENSHTTTSNCKDRIPTKTLSLKEFHDQFERPPPVEKSPQKTMEKVSAKSPTLGAGDFFSTIEKEVSQIEDKERNQNQSKQTRDKSNVENNMSELSLSNVVFHDSPHVEQTNGRIVELENELETWKKNYQQVKKRNRQLLVILQQGEMKDKVDLVLEVERLTQMRDELTDEITRLNECLEKERSKVSKLKDELKGTTAKKKP